MSKLLFMALVGTCLGCSTLPPPRPKSAMTLYFDSEAMRAELEKHVPVGTPDARARAVMRDSGFECKEETNEKGSARLHFLAIYRPEQSMSTRIGLADEIWVDLLCEKGVVKRIEVRCDTCGP